MFQVVYENRLEEPLPGHRQFHVSTHVQCKEGAKQELPSLKGYVFVQKAVDPVLSISGAAIVSADHHQVFFNALKLKLEVLQVKVGAPMLPDVQITVSQTAPSKSFLLLLLSSIPSYSERTEGVPSCFDALT